MMRKMTKFYNVEIKLGSRWTLTKVFTRHTDALHYIKENSGERYPYRIIRVIRSIVFDGEK
jgi:hypothetical protein